MSVVFCKLRDFIKYLLRSLLGDVVRAEGSVRGREGKAVDPEERKGGVRGMEKREGCR